MCFVHFRRPPYSSPHRGRALRDEMKRFIAHDVAKSLGDLEGGDRLAAAMKPPMAAPATTAETVNDLNGG